MRSVAEKGRERTGRYGGEEHDGEEGDEGEEEETHVGGFLCGVWWVGLMGGRMEE